MSTAERSETAILAQLIGFDEAMESDSVEAVEAYIASEPDADPERVDEFRRQFDELREFRQRFRDDLAEELTELRRREHRC